MDVTTSLCKLKATPFPFSLSSVGEPDAQLNPKKKVFEAVQPNFLTNDDCVACYKGVPFTVPGKGVCRSQTMKGTGIK